MFFGLTTEPLKEDDKISMFVNLIKGNKLIKKKAKCYARKSIEPKNKAQFQIGFKCQVENIERGNEYTGLEIIPSENIAGIPTDPILLNPAEIDKLIEAEDIKNYTSDELEDIPIFNSTSIDTTDSEEKGIFIINGEFINDHKPKKSIVFFGL